MNRRLAFCFPWIIMPHQANGMPKKQRRDCSSIEKQLGSVPLLLDAPVEKHGIYPPESREKTGHLRASERDCRHCQSHSQHKGGWQMWLQEKSSKICI
jgi:hypothetical protein